MVLRVLPYCGLMYNSYAILIIMAASSVSSFHLAEWSTLILICFQVFLFEMPSLLYSQTDWWAVPSKFEMFAGGGLLDIGYCAIF